MESMNKINIVTVKYRGSSSSREYDYYLDSDINVVAGDVVVVSMAHGEKHAIVTKVSQFALSSVIRVGE